jgi:hypothetical protein
MGVRISSAIVNIVILTIILVIKDAGLIAQVALRASTPLGPVSADINTWNTKLLSYLQLLYITISLACRITKLIGNCRFFLISRWNRPF